MYEKFPQERSASVPVSQSGGAHTAPRAYMHICTALSLSLPLSISVSLSLSFSLSLSLYHPKHSSTDISVAQSTQSALEMGAQLPLQ